MTNKIETVKLGDWVRVTTHYCEMAQRVGKVKEISNSPADSMPVMVKFPHNGRLWPFSAEELEPLGGKEPLTDSQGFLIKAPK